MDKEIEKAKNKLLNLEELTDEEMELLQNNFTPEQLDELLRTSMFPSAEKALDIVNSNLIQLGTYISGQFATNANIKGADNSIVDLLRGVLIFINNFRENVKDIKENTVDLKWQFPVD